MKKGNPKNTIITCLIIFALLIAVHAFEAIVLRMDETFFAENFLNKLFGIAVIFIVLKIYHWEWENIGFVKKEAVKNIIVGTVLAAVSFLVAFLAEIAIFGAIHKRVSFGFYTTSFSLTGQTVVHTGVGFILMCVFFNVINVVMEEGDVQRAVL